MMPCDRMCCLSMLLLCSSSKPTLTAPSAATQEAPVASRVRVAGDARHHMMVPKDATGPETHQKHGPVRQWWTTTKMHNVWYVN
jgi:hypothetical protein